MLSQPKSDDHLRRLAEDLELAVTHKRYGGQILFFTPYEKQREFLDLGAVKRERLPDCRKSQWKIAYGGL